MLMADERTKHPSDEIGIPYAICAASAGVTLVDLAAATNLDKGYLSRIECNLKVPSIATVLKIARFFGVPVAQLFGQTLGKRSHPRVPCQRPCRAFSNQ